MVVYNESVNLGKASHRDPLGFYWEIEYIPGPASRAAGLQYGKEIVHNILLDEGERNLLDVYFRAANVPTGGFFVGLHSGVIAETDTLAQIVEPSQLGYVRKALARNTTDWGAPALDAGDFQSTAVLVAFVAAATWTQVNRMFLASTSTGAVGSVILEAALSIPRTLASEDTLNVTAKAKAQ